MTCWRRLRDWTRAGVWAKLHERLLAEPEGAGQIDWSRAAIDGAHARARGGGEATGPSPVDRRKRGSKHFVVTDGGGVPLAATTTAANPPDVKALEHAIDAIRPVRGKPGRPKRRPREWYADRGLDSDPHRRRPRRRGIRPRIARRNTPHGRGPGGLPVGERADHVVVARLRQAPGAEGPIGWDPSIVLDARLRDHLSQDVMLTLILLGLLRACSWGWPRASHEPRILRVM